MNLVDNAFKFTSEGLIEIGCKPKNAETLLFYIKDTGIGIPPKKLEVIFERFRQATDAYLSSKFGGTGLGLSISKGLVELMEGEIWVESLEGKGTTFFFTIPLKQKGQPTNNINKINQSVNG
jgi:signal transduction histidine kinase